MANKTWKFTVTYQSPEDADKTPMQRAEESVQVEATTAQRALNKAKVAVCEEWEGVEAKDVVFLDVYRTAKYVTFEVE